MTQVRELKEKLERENVCLREEIKLEHFHAEVVGNSAAEVLGLKATTLEAKMKKLGIRRPR